MKEAFRRNKRGKFIWTMFIAVLAVMLFLPSLLTGCNSSSSDDSDESGYLIDGRVTDSTGNMFVAGATCELETYSGEVGAKSVLQTVTTDEDGYFYFSRVQAGKYQIAVSKAGYITANSVFDLEADFTDEIILTAQNQWESVYGADHPYSSTDHYLAVRVLPAVGVKADGLSSVAVDISENKKGKAAKAYGDQGFMHESGSVDWDATVTYSNGHAFFHDVDSTTTYTIKLSKNHHTFDTISDAHTKAGQVTTYVVRGEDLGAPVTQVPSNSPFGYYIGINYETWTVGRGSRSISADLAQISQYFKLIRTYHSTAVGTSDPTQPQIEPTQQEAIDYVVANNMEIVMGTNMNEIVQGTYGAWKPGLMCDSTYTDAWVQMLISSFGSVDNVKAHLKAIAIGNELDQNGPPPNDGSFNDYKDTWITSSFTNLKNSMSNAGLGDIPITTTIANYGSGNAVSVSVTKYINDNWSPSWNNGSPFVMYNQYTPNYGKSTDYNSVIDYFTNLQTTLQVPPLNVEVFVGETGFSAEYGLQNEINVVNTMFNWLDGLYQANGNTIPLFVFEAFDLPDAPAGQKQFGIFAETTGNVPNGLKTYKDPDTGQTSTINVPSWSTTPR